MKGSLSALVFVLSPTLLLSCGRIGYAPLPAVATSDALAEQRDGGPASGSSSPDGRATGAAGGTTGGSGGAAGGSGIAGRGGAPGMNGGPAVDAAMMAGDARRAMDAPGAGV